MTVSCLTAIDEVQESQPSMYFHSNIGNRLIFIVVGKAAFKTILITYEHTQKNPLFLEFFRLKKTLSSRRHYANYFFNTSNR